MREIRWIAVIFVSPRLNDLLNKQLISRWFAVTWRSTDGKIIRNYGHNSVSFSCYYVLECGSSFVYIYAWLHAETRAAVLLKWSCRIWVKQLMSICKKKHGKPHIRHKAAQSLSLYIYFMLGMETEINWEFLENQWQIFYVYFVTSPFKLYFTNFVTKRFDEQSSNLIDIHYHFENQITFLHISRYLYYVSHTDVLLVKIICNKTGNQTMFNNLSSGSTYFKHIIDHN